MQQPLQAIILVNDKPVLAAGRAPRVEIAGAQVLESHHSCNCKENSVGSDRRRPAESSPQPLSKCQAGGLDL